MTLMLCTLTAPLAVENLIFHFLLAKDNLPSGFLKSGRPGDNAAAVAASEFAGVFAGPLACIALTGAANALISACAAVLICGLVWAVSKFVLRSGAAKYLTVAPFNAAVAVFLMADGIPAGTIAEAAPEALAAGVCAALTVMIYSSAYTRLAYLRTGGIKNAVAPVAATALILVLAFWGF